MDDIFVSGFVDEILDFMDYYEEQGNDRRSVSYALHFFDNYCYNKYREERTFTRDDANNFYKTKPKNIKDNTFYSLTGALNRFTSYLVALGYDIGVIPTLVNISCTNKSMKSWFACTLSLQSNVEAAAI